jgi:hypothetical protein
MIDVGSIVRAKVAATALVTPHTGVVISTLGRNASVMWPFGCTLEPTSSLVESTSPSKVAGSVSTQIQQGLHAGLSDLETYHLVTASKGSYGEADLRLRASISSYYRTASDISCHLRSKVAAYWAGKDRKYRATRSELKSRKVTCPNCKSTDMRRTTYKMEAGQRVKLFACSSCFHLIRQSDVLDNLGGSVDW